MSRGSLLIGLPLSGFPLVSGCFSELVDLGDNVDAGPIAQEAPPDSAPSPDASPPGQTTDASTPSPQGDASDGAEPGPCLRNPLFGGDTTTAPGIMQWMSPNLPDWQVCSGSVDVNPGVCTIPPPPGTTTYIGLPVGYAAFQHAVWTSVNTPLLGVVPPGMYPFSIELGVAISTLPQEGYGVAGGAPVELVIYGSLDPCSRDQELARTSLISNTDSFGAYSGVLTASQPFSNLVLVPTLQDPFGQTGQAGAYVVVADFSSPSCN
jgi:hypothetical protein